MLEGPDTQDPLDLDTRAPQEPQRLVQPVHQSRGLPGLVQLVSLGLLVQLSLGLPVNLVKHLEQVLPDQLVLRSLGLLVQLLLGLPVMRLQVLLDRQ